MTWHNNVWDRSEQSDILRMISICCVSHLVPRDFSQVLVFLFAKHDIQKDDNRCALKIRKYNILNKTIINYIDFQYKIFFPFRINTIQVYRSPKWIKYAHISESFSEFQGKKLLEIWRDDTETRNCLILRMTIRPKGHGVGFSLKLLKLPKWAWHVCVHTSTHIQPYFYEFLWSWTV